MLPTLNTYFTPNWVIGTPVPPLTAEHSAAFGVTPVKLAYSCRSPALLQSKFISTSPVTQFINGPLKRFETYPRFEKQPQPRSQILRSAGVALFRDIVY